VRDALRRVARPRRRWAERFDDQFSTLWALYKQMGVAGCPILHKARLNGAASSACGIDAGIHYVKRASPPRAGRSSTRCGMKFGARATKESQFRDRADRRGRASDGASEIAEQIVDLPIRRECPTRFGGLVDHVNRPTCGERRPADVGSTRQHLKTGSGTPSPHTRGHRHTACALSQCKPLEHSESCITTA
jgi:hypothetical protein